MSISASFLVARTALRATEIRAGLVTSNVAHASTPGYVRRDALQVAMGSGVDVALLRRADEGLSALVRGASGDAAAAEARSEVLGGHLSALGDPSDGRSPAALIGRLQAGFDLLANAPGEAGIQRDVVERAVALARGLNEAAGSVAAASARADDAMQAGVSQANEALGRIASLNERIASAGPEPDTLDRMAAEIDELSQLMSVEISHDGLGRVRLHTTGGTELVTSTGVQALSWQDGTLRAGEADITPGRTGARSFEGGRLAGLAHVANEVLPEMAGQLDALAFGVASTFDAADTSLNGAAGLFTDAGDKAVGAAGLAARISVNERVLPSSGGAWRLRDGIGAEVPGADSASGQVLAFVAAMETRQTFPAEAGLGQSDTLAGYAATLVAAQQAHGTRAAEDLGQAKVALAGYEDARAGVEGVNVDTEMQKLLEIEQSYGANAKVLTTLTTMIDTLLDAT